MSDLILTVAALAGFLITTGCATIAGTIMLTAAASRWRHRYARHDRVRLGRRERRTFNAMAAHHASPAGWADGDNPDKALPAGPPLGGRPAKGVPALWAVRAPPFLYSKDIHVQPIQVTRTDTSRPEWLAARREGIGASDIAMCLGLSPHGSPFSLYWEKTLPTGDEDTDLTATGRHLESTIADWWAGENTDYKTEVTGMWRSHDRPWQLATPDRLIYPACHACDGGGFVNLGEPWTDRMVCMACYGHGYRRDFPPVAVLECKWVAYSWDGWGEASTNQIPVHYACQVQWQMDVMNVAVAYVAALGPGGFREYVVECDEPDIRVLREHGQRFWDRVEAGDAPPIDDGHPATTETLKRLHPSLTDETVEIPVETAEAWRRARALAKRADHATKRLENRIRQTMGTARRSECNGHLVLSRSINEAATDLAELDALDTDRQTTDRLTPGRTNSYRVINPKRRR